MHDTAHHDYAALWEAPGRTDMAPKDVSEEGVQVRQLPVFHPEDCNAGLGHVRSDEWGEGLVGEGNADWRWVGTYPNNNNGLDNSNDSHPTCLTTCVLHLKDFFIN